MTNNDLENIQIKLKIELQFGYFVMQIYVLLGACRSKQA